LVLLLPITYVAITVLLSEWNPRYHVNALPFLIILAAAAVSHRRTPRDWIIPLALIAVVFWAPAGIAVVPPLIFAIVLTTGLRISLGFWRFTRSHWGEWTARRRVAIGAATLAGLQFVVAFALLGARAALVDWSIARPDRWTPYGEARAESGSSATVSPNDLHSDVRRVSFQDSVVVPRVASREPGGAVGLVRTFPDLEIGSRYALYMQVGIDRSATDEILVVANGKVVWQASRGSGDHNGWHDVIVPWVADSPFLVLQLERVAGDPPDESPVLVRSTHLYPRY
jgi:hypothetical protein